MKIKFGYSNMRKTSFEKINYPPDFTEEAISRVVNQAEFMM